MSVCDCGIMGLALLILLVFLFCVHFIFFTPVFTSLLLVIFSVFIPSSASLAADVERYISIDYYIYSVIYLRVCGRTYSALLREVIYLLFITLLDICFFLCRFDWYMEDER